jgi:hypothetical protein
MAKDCKRPELNKTSIRYQKYLSQMAHVRIVMARRQDMASHDKAWAALFMA